MLTGDGVSFEAVDEFDRVYQSATEWECGLACTWQQIVDTMGGHTEVVDVVRKFVPYVEERERQR